MNINIFAHLAKSIIAMVLLLTINFAFAHGDVTPQAVDTSELKQLGSEWLIINPYVDDQDAIALGKSAYNSNCARCHGLGAVSGGVAPDLRALDKDEETDEWFISRVREGVIRNNIPYMPKFEGLLTQEAMWAIRAWLITLDSPN